MSYPNATCQMCGKICNITEEVNIGMGEIELWNYCQECDIETFHQIPYDKINYPNNTEKPEY